MRLSISRIKTFKACRRKYELRYIEGLKPVETPDALETGKNYHKLLEELNTNGSLPEMEFTKEYAMAKAYEKYIYPKFKVIKAEKWLEYDMGRGDKLVGIVDAIAEGGYIVEHKTYGGNDSMEQYEYNLLWDEQILAYMLMTGNRKVWYTVCRKPTIRQKQNETEQEFYERMLAWYDTDTESKIKLLELERTDSEVEAFKDELEAMAGTMEICEANRENSPHNFYRNNCNCNLWGRRCEYSSVCLYYDPNLDYVAFTKGEKDYEPTEN